MKKLFYSLLGLAAVFAIYVQCVYLYKFGSLSNPTLSDHVEEWGQYGDFLAGTIGTYFGFLAFIGVLYTVLLQDQQLELAREQLQHARRQSSLEEVQRFLASRADRIDTFLHSSPKIPPSGLEKKLQGQPLPLSIHKILMAAVSLKLGFYQDLPVDARPYLLSQMMECLRHDVPTILVELQQLVTGLELYERNDGSADILWLYRKRYDAEVGSMHLLGLLQAPRVAKYFEAEKVSADILRDNAQESA